MPFPVALSALTLACVATGLKQRHGAAKSPPEGEDPDRQCKPSPPPPTFTVLTALWPATLILLLTCALGYGALKWGRSGPPAFDCAPADMAERITLFEKMVRAHAVDSTDQLVPAIFDQGLFLRFGFDELEANRSFEEAVGRDPDCAMCWWGLAYANAPNQNKVPGVPGGPFPVFSEADSAQAAGWTSRGLEIAERKLKADPKSEGLGREAAYLRAMGSRFPPSGRWSGHAQLAGEVRFAQMMLALGTRGTGDADALAMAAEALMNLSPWEYHLGVGEKQPDVSWKGIWGDLVRNAQGGLEDDPGAFDVDLSAALPDLTSVRGREVTATAMKRSARLAERLLLRVLEMDPDHVLALHLHIHITEASTPGRGAGGAEMGEASADKLRGIMPRLGHLTHMPSHNFLRMGRYGDGVDANQEAWEMDLRHSSKCVSPYLPEHNNNMLIYCASMAGMLGAAQRQGQAARDALGKLYPPYVVDGMDWAPLVTVWLRFAQWDRLQAMEEPPLDARGWISQGGYKFSVALWRFAHFLLRAADLEMPKIEGGSRAARKLAAKLSDEKVAAERAFLDLKAVVEEIPEDVKTMPGQGVGIYTQAYGALARIMYLQASAKWELLRGNPDVAVSSMAEAVNVSDALGYMEPPREHQPSRQCLGWVLLQAGRPDEAEAVYRRDLWEFPENAWSLLGLAQSLEAQGPDRKEEADAALDRHRAAWRGGQDGVRLTSSCPMLSSRAS
ncbi:unnamed protein product [Ostreobium quekettii]|uniref:Uncharacterized protein n=1 Tax=Ostreobium quekettii TaxID=121088 RepID=A0A8S1J1E7_9CHLO|nr:unnamed protein product [Ostreobium quekettii]|eukprot:evm.model.scf_618.1 EVM.evm.TU.scf_618.1   scf_618:9369-12455(+)